jgi:hypothetical protein
MRALRRLLLLLPLVALATQLLPARNARGLPLFARKNGMPCTSCHFAFPRLNSFGMAFRQNGYRLPGQEGEAPWEAKEFPLALVGNVGYAYTNLDTLDTATNNRGSFATSQFVQNAFELHSAGTLAKDFSFHFDADFEGAGLPLTSGQAYLQFDDLAKDGVLNLRAGIFDADMLYLASSRRLTNTDYLLPVTLDGAGFEANGLRSGWTYALGVINSGRTIGKPNASSINNLENPYAWVTLDVHGGQLVGGRIYLDRQDPRASDKNSSLHTQMELNAFLNGGDRWVLIPEFTYENFSDADLTQRDKIQSGMLEGSLFLDKNQRVLFTGRYELRHMPKFDYQGSQAFAEEDDAQEVANLSWYSNPNAKVGLEWAHLSDNVQGPRINQFQVYVHVGY